MDAPRLRFAPSPSGFLHIGGARTALFCWLLARRHGGSFILRVEDTDRERSTDASIQAILDAMSWLGLDWDEGPGVDGPHGPYFQSQRRPVYDEHIQRLLDSGDLYRCYCTKDELDRKRAEAMAANRRPVYDRTCRYRDPASWTDDEPYVLRLKAPLDGDTVVDDLIRGKVVFPNVELSDQVVVRSNGDPLYNFVVVVDDATMGVTHVVRGDDHLSNTPKQVQLYRALGYDVPSFAHLPLILGEDKKRLSKRHGATNVMQYAEEGYLPGALVNFLARLGWSCGDQELFSVDELVEKFGLDAVGKAAGVWNPGKLEWVNHQWMMKTPSDELARLAAPRIAEAGLPDSEIDGTMLYRIDTLKERAKTLTELVDQGRFYWAAADDVTVEDKARRKWLKQGTLPGLKACLEALEALPEWTEETIEQALHGVMERLELKMGKIAQPLRVAVTGTTMSPGIYPTLSALGRDKTLTRVRHAITLVPPPAV
jgi:glutamyl-tRNA synthetase